MAAKNNIVIKGARQHNLKNIDVEIARNQMTVVTGVSGSGKSSLVFDTLYAEGQRRYVESLSAYARQFMDKMNKPEVDYIKGISPAIAIEQKVNTRNPRSTVSTSTEIYDYLKLLFTKVGKTISPISGQVVKRHSVGDVVDFITGLENESTVLVLSRLNTKRKLDEELKVLLQKGFTRILTTNGVEKIEEVLELPAKDLKKIKPENTRLVVDRVLTDSTDEELPSRLGDSVQTAFLEGDQECIVQVTNPQGKEHTLQFSARFEADGMVFELPGTNFFSFNNPYGACKTCEGFGLVIGIDEDLVIPDKSMSVFEGAVAPWRGDSMQVWRDEFVAKAIHLDFPIHRSYYELDEKEKAMLWNGLKGVPGIDHFFKYLEEKIYKIQYRVMLSKYRGKTTCPDCRGTRLRKDANYVKLLNEANPDEKLSIADIVLMSVSRAHEYFTNLQLNPTDAKIADRIFKEIINRLTFMKEVGLGYLTLNRLSNTLSGGESQRINLATSLGSSLVGSMYILDEPSIGLHSRDTENLIRVLKSLRDLGNTVVIVEHDEDVMIAADDLIDIGPFAGRNGGDLIFKGNFDQMLADEHSLTGKYLSGRAEIPVPERRRKWSDHIEIKGARENNLKNVDAKIPLHVITAVTGVSGSGKTSLIKTIFYPALQKLIGSYSGGKTGQHDKIEGDYKKVTQVEMVDQNPIGKSSRSNPVTYIKAYDAIRELFAIQPLAKTRAYKSSFFSFNVDGGRCETCQGEGETTIEMQFMADLHLPCETCHGKRFKDEVLEVQYKGKNIADVLEMTVDEAMDFFSEAKTLHNKLKPLQDVGLGYVSLGQSSSTLSGGEAQRIKLASFLGKASRDQHIVFIFDEPTTGLHFHDINKLMGSFNALIEQGHTIVIIEHNMDVIKCADWIIDIGPEGGDAGGHIVFEGIPEDLVNVKESYTAEYLAGKLGRKSVNLN